MFFFIFPYQILIIIQKEMVNTLSLSEINIIANNIEEQNQKVHEEGHISIGEMIKSIIYGGVDGTVNTTIIILSGVSSGTPIHNIFAIVVASVIAGAVDMACCDYVSAKAEIQYVEQEQERELYEVRNCLSEEKDEIVELYSNKGYAKEDCVRLADLFATHEGAFVNIMLLQELRLVKVKDALFPAKCGLATLISFALFGFVTAFPYILNEIIAIKVALWPFVIALAVIELLSLGLIKSQLLGLNKVRAAGKILLMGAVATAVGFGIGQLFPAH